MYNATNSAPHRPSAYRVDALRTLSLRSTAQLNDLFITPRRNVAYSIAALFGSTQRFVCQFIIAPRHGSRQRTAAQLALPRRAATQRNDLFVTFRASPRSDLARRVAAPRNATICLLQRFSLHRPATHHTAPRRSTTQRNDLFVNLLSRLGSTRRNSSCLIAPQFNSTICLSIYYYNAPFCIAPPRSAPRLNAPHINATN